MIWERPVEDAVYIVTDVECDGPTPGRNSMLAFASVAVTADGAEQGAFEAVLRPLPEASPDADTLAWFRAQPEAWAAATRNPQSPGEAMAAYAAWVDGFTAARIFTAYPVTLDGAWIDFYLRRFTPFCLVAGHYARGRLFDGPGLCLRSYAAGIARRAPWDCSPGSLPQEWFGGHAHSHRAMDDARGYACLLGNLTRLRVAGGRVSA